MFMVEKKSLTEYSYSVKDGKSKSFPRCHLASQLLVLLQDTNIPPATDVCPHVAEYSGKHPFDCTLSGPFANLFLIRLSATRTLCKGIIAVISASTV